MFYSRNFQDLDQLISSVEGWDLDFIPLENGNFTSQIMQMSLEHTMIGEAVFDKKVEQRGRAPAGYLTFVVPKDPLVNYFWRGFEHKGNMISLFPPSGEIYSVTNETFSVYTISFTEEIVQTVCLILCCSDTEKQLAGELVWEVDARLMADIRSKIAALINKRNARQKFDSYYDELDLLLSILNSLKIFITSGSFRPSRSMSEIDGLLTKIHRATPCEPIQLNELYNSTNKSERFLQYQFKKRFGISPVKYVKKLKLMRAFKDLNNPMNLWPIRSIAMDHGFWHMGQFAADYRRYFGELPSATRKRVLERLAK